MENVVSYDNKVHNFSGNVLEQEVFHFVLLAVIFGQRMNLIVNLIDSFNLVNILHDNGEEKYKMKHSPDPIRLINFIIDRMTNKPASTKNIYVHQVACSYAHYLIQQPGLNIPIENLAHY